MTKLTDFRGMATEMPARSARQEIAPPACPLPAVWQVLQIVARPLAFLDECARTYGDTFALRVLGPKAPAAIFLSDPALVRQVFAAGPEVFELGKVTHPFRPLVGDRSLILQDGKTHQRSRQLLMPPLHGDAMLSWGEAICKIAAERGNSWRSPARIPVLEAMLDISLEVILRVVFGFERGDRLEALKGAIARLLAWVTAPLNSTQFFFPFLQRDWGSRSPWGYFLQQQRCVDELLYGEIECRKQRGTEGRTDVLSLLLDARDEKGRLLDRKTLRDQLLTLLFLGHETTAASLSWALFWVHRHPATLQRLHGELDALGDRPDPLEIARSPYLTAICKESLRVYPIALIAQPRVAREPISLGKYGCDRGAIVIPCIYNAHRRAETYPEPEKFLPDRFLERKYSPTEFFPFGGGSRSCIGGAFSMFEMKLVLATLLRHHQFSLDPSLPVKPVRRGITFVPSSNFELVCQA